jgi:tetratricopeptide (TPR) repeat protein/TolB-like protein
MPYVEGESLRERLNRQHVLSIDEVLRILREVADALAYAHLHGVIHRDIKPDNILLSAGHAVVTDFGLAKALFESRSESMPDTLTRPGVTLGTAPYMAPEQVTGDVDADHRVDLYSLGCLAYELLTGAPPFGYAPVHRLLSAHTHEAPAPISKRRADVPPRLAELVMQCLSKHPEQRPKSASAMVAELDTIARQRQTAWSMLRRRRWLLAAACLVIGTGVTLYVAGAARETYDADLVAVLPFRVSSDDPLLRSLREGMVDLLSAKFTGSARVVDPRSLFVLWRREGGSDTSDVDEPKSVRIARQFRAAQLLLGTVSAAGQTVILTAELRDVRHGTGRQAVVQGARDSLPVLIDRLVAQLLAFRAGEDAHAVASLGSRSIGSLREYIQAQALSRRGRFEDALPHYRAAIATDSNFALAGMGLGLAVGWLDAGDWNEGWRVAWRGRDQLSAIDRAVLEAWVGPAYPRWASKSELRVLAERAVQIAPHRFEAWYALGDNLYHFGALQGVEDAHLQALNALNRAVSIDSTNAYAVEHLPDLYLQAGDTASARHAAEYLLSLDSTSRYGTFGLWYASTVFGDERRHSRAMKALERMISTSVSTDIAQSALTTGVGYEDAEYLLGRLVTGGSTEDERSRARTWLFQLANARGRISLAARLFNDATVLRAPALFAGVFEGGDSATTARARRSARGAFRADSMMTRCTEAALAALYDVLMRGDSTTADSLARTLTKRLSTAPDTAVDECDLAAKTLRVQLAMRGAGASLRALTLQLDSALRTVPPSPLLAIMTGNLVVAHAFEQLGEPANALAAARRRPVLYGPLQGWPAMLLIEARLAEATGNHMRALEAYRRFTALRAVAEPPLQPELRDARTELALLERDNPSRR